MKFIKFFVLLMWSLAASAVINTNPFILHGTQVYGINNADGTVSTLSPKTNVPEIALARYRSIPNSTGRNIAVVGDSTAVKMFLQSVGSFTYLLANDGSDYAHNMFGYPGGPFYQVTWGNFGDNGQTVKNFINGAANTGKNISDIVAFKPDLIWFGYGGINDRRLDARTKAQIKADIITAITTLQTLIPTADIVYQMPPTFNLDTTNANSFWGSGGNPATFNALTSGQKFSLVQLMSDDLRQIAQELKGYFPNFYVLDNQSGSGQQYPTKVVSTTNLGIYKADDLHPNGEGFAVKIREFALAIGDFGSNRYAKYNTGILPLYPPITAAESAHATATQATDYLLMPRICEDNTKYNQILVGNYYSSVAGSYLNLGGALNDGDATSAYQGVVANGDIIVQYGTTDTTPGSQGESIENGSAAFTVASGLSLASNGLLLGMPAGYPHVQGVGQVVKVFRARPATQKYPQDLAFNAVFAAADFTAATQTFTVQRFGVVGRNRIIANAGTAPTTGGTITIKKNGATIGTLTFANNATTATWADAGTPGYYFDEGDIITAVVNAGFVGGANLKIRISA